MECDGLAAGDLVLAEDLQEVQVAEFAAVGLDQPRVEFSSIPDSRRTLSDLRRAVSITLIDGLLLGVIAARGALGLAGDPGGDARGEQALGPVKEGRGPGVAGLRLGVGLGAPRSGCP
ncbi:hypothetical protein ACIG0C_17915 [Kitasatospora aureofaciens]|uniref:Uncharacterized protein n=1 Tax=Kitasatospora aureofaciens TaxID=1894 RepID=A0A1E7N991_KITAU|nr:hypothetical protein [Kitasatospora aureofaciens]OEV37262.1 hypothetical protein HS99_0005540 [Kitasatospora aureofaciens]GGU95778.1 hypothetical protein GCM10010502_57110 [Kitasatospora aureofaciens]